MTPRKLLTSLLLVNLALLQGTAVAAGESTEDNQVPWATPQSWDERVSQPEPQTLNAPVEWDSKVIRVDAEPTDERAVGRFRFTNVGDEPLRIKGVKASCGCTAATPDKMVFQPGESGEVEAVFRFGNRSGYQRKSVTVSFKDYQNPEIVVLETQIPELVQAEPRLLQWRIEEAPTAKEVVLTTYDSPQMKILGAESTSPSFKANLEKQENGEYLLKVEPVATDGRQRGVVAVTYQYGDSKPGRLNVYTTVR